MVSRSARGWSAQASAVRGGDEPPLAVETLRVTVNTVKSMVRGVPTMTRIGSVAELVGRSRDPMRTSLRRRSSRAWARTMRASNDAEREVRGDSGETTS
jgi:hypothetical protein